MEAAWKLFGTLTGILVAWYLESRYVRFETKALWWAQLLKLGIGLLLVVGVKSGLKPVLNALIPDAGVAGAVRYFLMAMMGGVIWPLSFRFWARLK